MQSLNDQKLFKKAELIRRIYDSPTEEEAIRLHNVLQCKKSKGDEISPQKAAAYQVYVGMSKEKYLATKKTTDKEGKVITKRAASTIITCEISLSFMNSSDVLI